MRAAERYRVGRPLQGILDAVGEISAVAIPADPEALVSSSSPHYAERLERVQRERDNRPVAGGECYKDY